LRDLDLRERLTTIEQEMIMKTLAMGYRMAEVPSHENRRLVGRSKISLWRHGPFYVLSLLRHLCRRRACPAGAARLVEGARSRSPRSFPASGASGGPAGQRS
jgi:hypothetical protein